MIEMTVKELTHKKKIILLLVIVLFLTGLLLYFQSEQLASSPFTHEMALDEPIAAVENTAGNTAILDSSGTRIFILSSDDKISATISYSAFSNLSPLSADCMAMDDSHLYILDHTFSEKGTAKTGDRVLVYNLKGKGEKVLITSKDMENEENLYRMVNLYTNQGRIFVTLYDEMDDTVLAVGEVTTGELNIIHTYHTAEEEVYDVFYQPEKDSTTAVTQKGNIYFWENDVERSWQLSETSVLIDDIYPYQEGFITLDRNGDTIGIYDSGMHIKEVLANTAAQSFFLSGEKLLYTDPQNYSFTRQDLNTGEKHQIEQLNFSTREIVLGYVVWFAVFAGGFSLFLLLLILIQWIIASFKKRKRMLEKKVETETQSNVKALTTFKLYGPIFGTVMFGFIITAIILGGVYYSKSVQTNHDAVANTGFILRGASADSFGGSLSQIHSQKDYGSDAYENLNEMVSTICMSNIDYSASYQLGKLIYRFSETDDSIMVVSDDSDQNRIGTILTREDQKKTLIFEAIEATKKGKIREEIVTYNNGTVYYMIYSPVYNAEGEIVGAVIPVMNDSFMKAQIRETLMIKLLEVFTLLAGLAMLLGEFIFIRDIAKIQRKRQAEGIRNTTVVEASRPLMILIRLPWFIITLFCTLIAMSILNNNGQETNAVLVALPLTVGSILATGVRVFLPPVCKYRPKFFMLLGTVIAILGTILFGLSIYLSNYVILISAMVFLGVGIGMAIVGVKAIRLAGVDPAPKYRLMVFCNMENHVASAIGAAMAAVIRGVFGDIAMVIYMAIVLLLTIPVILFFVGNDIAVQKEKEKEHELSEIVWASRKAAFSDILRFCLRPIMVIVFVLTLLPLNYLYLFKSYVLPLMNESQGLPSCLIGTITLGVQLVTVLIIPPIMKKVLHKPNSMWISGALIILTMVLLVFGWQSTMKTFVPILVVVEISSTICFSIADIITISEAQKANVIVNNVMIPYELFDNVASFTGPMLLSFMMVGGIGNLGWYWGIICGVFACLTILLGKKGDVLSKSK